MRRDEKPCSSLSISKRNLLLETKAISIPEKKPESRRITIVAIMVEVSIIDGLVLSLRRGRFRRS